MESYFEASSRIEKGLCSELGKAYKNNDNYCIGLISSDTFLLLISTVYPAANVIHSRKGLG